MKRLILVMIMVFYVNSLFASPIDSSLIELLDEISRAYSAEMETLYSKRNLAIGTIENLSETAKANYIGEGVKALLKPLIGNSLLFQLVDRDNLDELIQEIEFSLSGMTDNSTAVRVGALENVQVILTGTVSELGEDFIISLQLIDLETSRILVAAESSIKKALLIKESKRIAYEYIMANGIGISLQITPAGFMLFPSDGWADMEHDLGGLTVDGTLTYRLNQNLKFALNFGGKFHTVFFDDRKYGSIQNMDPAILTSLTTNDGFDPGLYTEDGSVISGNSWEAIANMPISYHLEQSVNYFSLLTSGVFPVTREFNLSLGVGPALDIITYRQNYDKMLVDIRDGAQFTRRVYEMSYMSFAMEAQAQVEYFILPRFSLNISGAYHHHFVIFSTDSDDGAYCTSTGEYFYERSSRDIAAFGLNPFLMPNGAELNAETFNGNFFHILIGFSVYF